MHDAEEKVILADVDDNQIGLMDKLEAHKKRFAPSLLFYSSL